MKTLMIAILFVVPNMALGAQAVPADVQAFIQKAEACKHFAGEFDGDLSDTRKKEIERSVVRHCRRAQKQLEKLKARYKDDPQIIDIIRANTNESVSSFR